MKSLMKAIKNVSFEKWMQFMICAAIATVYFINPVVAQASNGADLINNYVNNVFEIIAAMVTSVGAIALLWAVFELGISMHGNDGMMMPSTFKRVIGGLIMTLAPQLVTAIKG